MEAHHASLEAKAQQVAIDVEHLASQWLYNDVTSVEEINHGLCADFATAIQKLHSEVRVIGVYDCEDLEYCGAYSQQFHAAVRQDLIGHTAVFFSGKFYDAEASNGVARFEDLPVNKRGMQALIGCGRAHDLLR